MGLMSEWSLAYIGTDSSTAQGAEQDHRSSRFRLGDKKEDAGVCLVDRKCSAYRWMERRIYKPSTFAYSKRANNGWSAGYNPRRIPICIGSRNTAKRKIYTYSSNMGSCSLMGP
jgi:hypothetical protein